MAKRGIDISSHQGNIDLATLKSQIDFVIIRVGYGTNGTLDTKFKRNADLCVQLGIPFGFYWYSYALNVEGARREAEAFLNAIEPYKDKYSYGCWFDMEDADGYKRKNGMPSNQTLREMCAMFCKIVDSSTGGSIACINSIVYTDIAPKTGVNNVKNNPSLNGNTIKIYKVTQTNVNEWLTLSIPGGYTVILDNYTKDKVYSASEIVQDSQVNINGAKLSTMDSNLPMKFLDDATWLSLIHIAKTESELYAKLP